MDIVIKFWDSSMNKGCSRYLSSSFMGHSTAEDTINNFLETSSETKSCNLVQVSMDGPNVNWSFLEQLSSDLHDEYGTTMPRFYRMQSVSKKVLFSKMGRKCRGLRKSARSSSTSSCTFPKRKN